MPEEFKDAAGRSYVLTLTLGKVRRIAEEIGIDILSDDDWEPLMKSLTKRLDYVYHLCTEGVEDYEVSRDTFDECLMPVAQEVSDAFLRELVSFYRSLKQEKLLIVTEKVLEAQAEEKKKIESGAFGEAIQSALASVG